MERLIAIAATVFEEVRTALEQAGAIVASELSPGLTALSRSLDDRAELLLLGTLLVVVLLALYHRIVVRRSLEKAQQARARWLERMDGAMISDVREEIASLAREVTALQYHIRGRHPALQSQDLNGTQPN